MGNISPSELAIYIYGFHIRKNELEHQYAIISEIYHPDFLTLGDVRQITSHVIRHPSSVNLSSEILEDVRTQMIVKYQ